MFEKEEEKLSLFSYDTIVYVDIPHECPSNYQALLEVVSKFRKGQYTNSILFIDKPNNWVMNLK